jgi:stearoyl-CoA desaturase (delta-9 desaturase)
MQWQMLLIALIMQFFITHFGISMTYHRCVSHNSVKLPKWLEFIGLMLAGLSFQGSALSWAAIHRSHHLYQGTERDPHSPKHLSSWYVHTFGYAFRTIEPKGIVKLLRTHHFYWHKYYYFIFVPILVLSLIFLEFNLALALFFAPIALTFQVVNCINTWTHAWDKDIPSDVPRVWIILGGEAWHEVHHRHPAKLRLHKYDWLGYLLEKLNQKTIDKTTSTGQNA